MVKCVFFVFKPDAICFVHVLLNSLDMFEQGIEGRIVMEGSATSIIPEVAQQKHPLHGLYQKVKEAELFDGACRACSAKMGVTASMEAEGFNLLDEMNGHPSVARYILAGYTVIPL